MNKLLPVTILCSLMCPILPGQGIKAFKFQIETLGGQKRSHDDFKNNVVILDFWGTWCLPCRRAIPGLVDLYKKYKHHGLEIIGLNYKEKGDRDQKLATVRQFAAQHGITYTLALGAPKIRDQVIGFSGYPTMLFFKKGMKFDHLEVGFDAKHVINMEKWVRAELGLEGDDAKSQKDEAKKPAKAEKVKVPAGVIYRPGNHDTGFEFTVKGVSGKQIKFSDFRGKKVVLVFTSTWDREAENTASILDELHQKYAAKDVVVLAASMEQKLDWKAKVAAIKAFTKKRGTAYTILPVGLDILKKVYEPSGIPFFLVFDEKGTLILRRKNNPKKLILKAIDQVLAS